MSRAPARNGAVAGQEDDICPVCKSNRYLNINMRFLVNPECYHKMCESCVDRIFSTGPAPCPIAGCARTLRKARFRRQTFEDLQIEREVDVRKRVADVFNRRQEEFNTLRDFNNYLEEVETLTFNLIYGVDVEVTEQKLEAYKKQNAPTIKKNAVLDQQESASAEAKFAAQKEQARLRRDSARQAEMDERKERADGREEVIKSIMSGDGDPDTIAKDAQTVVLKKSTARRTLAQKSQRQGDIKADNAAAPVFEIQGLKAVLEPEPEVDYDAFGGLAFSHEYYTLKPEYENPNHDQVKADVQVTTGGYDIREYCARAMLEAFAGLGIFVEDEIELRDNGDNADVATMAAAAAAGGGEGIDGDVL